MTVEVAQVNGQTRITHLMVQPKLDEKTAIVINREEARNKASIILQTLYPRSDRVENHPLGVGDQASEKPPRMASLGDVVYVFAWHEVINTWYRSANRVSICMGPEGNLLTYDAYFADLPLVFPSIAPDQASRMAAGAVEAAAGKAGYTIIARTLLYCDLGSPHTPPVWTAEYKATVPAPPGQRPYSFAVVVTVNGLTGELRLRR